MKIFGRLTFCLLCLGLYNPSFATAEKVYKWTDAKGQTHYSQRPPLNTQTEVLKPETGHSDPVDYTRATTQDIQNQDAQKKEVGAKPTPTKDKDPDRCNNARQNLETLQTHARIRTKGDDGEYRYLTPDEQQEKQEEANRVIEESCE